MAVILGLPERLVHVDSLFDVLLAADLEARSQRDGVFECLCRAVAGRWQERVCAVSDLDDTRRRGCPAILSDREMPF